LGAKSFTEAIAEDCGVVRITLVSNYLDFSSLLNDRADISWRSSALRDPIPDAELFISDYFPDLDLKAFVANRPAARHLVLTESKWLEFLTDVQGRAYILLKPANAFTLRAFIELAFKTWKTHCQAREADMLRLDRDALLQYVLEVNVKLKKYDQERANFLARALHDFRTPLSALSGYCGLLAEGKLGAVSRPQQELLDRMSYSTRRLARLAEGTLELLPGRIERSSSFGKGDLRKTLDQALYDVYLLIKDKGLSVEIDIAQPIKELSYKQEQIQQVFVNLLENSCKFTPRLGSIKICGVNVGSDLLGVDGYRMDITDSGPGIPAGRTERIFAEYGSYLGGEDRSTGGRGLAICKSIIAAHHGIIWAHPTDHEGRFSFVLPYRLLADTDGRLNLASDGFKVQCAECH
jgi:signal transduction histidine kinase